MLLEFLIDLKRRTRVRTRWRELVAGQRGSARALPSEYEVVARPVHQPTTSEAALPPHQPSISKTVMFSETEQRIIDAVQIRKLHGWSASREAWEGLWKDRDRLGVVSTKKLLHPKTTAVVDFDDVQPGKPSDRPIRWCIYTTVFGAYDTLQPILNAPENVDCICFADSHIEVEGWKTIVVPSGRGGVRGAKEYKILPHVHLSEYDASLFIDANTLVHGRIEDFVERWCLGYPFVMWRHSGRCDVYDEADAILALYKAEPQIVINQIMKYEQAGLPHETGLVEGGFIWRHHSDAVVSNFMEAWAAETRNGSARDQLSLGFLMWKLQTRPKTFPSYLGNIRQNCVSAIGAHRAVKPDFEVPHVRTASSVQKVCFLYEPEYLRAGSTVMRGEQLSAMLNEKLSDRFEISFIPRHENVRDAILILTKGCTIRISPDELADLRKTNAGVVADFVDGEIRRDLLSSIDIVWAASISAFRHALLEPNFPMVDLVTHHVDPRLPKPKPRYDFSAAYVGEPVNAVWSESLQSVVDLLYVNTKNANEDWLQKVSDYSLHYAIRPASTSKKPVHKPFLKGFTAAHCDANLIISRDEGDAVSYLGDDYPYLTEGRSIEDAIRGLEYARESFGSREWERGLAVMREVRERSSHAYIVNEVCRSLARFR